MSVICKLDSDTHALVQVQPKFEYDKTTNRFTPKTKRQSLHDSPYIVHCVDEDGKNQYKIYQEVPEHQVECVGIALVIMKPIGAH